jgi:hypothetical protein
MVLPQTTLGQISIAPGQADPHPGEKREKSQLNNKQAAEKKNTCKKEGRAPRALESEGGAHPHLNCKFTGRPEKSGAAAPTQQPWRGESL